MIRSAHPTASLMAVIVAGTLAHRRTVQPPGWQNASGAMLVFRSSMAAAAEDLLSRLVQELRELISASSPFVLLIRITPGRGGPGGGLGWL